MLTNKLIKCNFQLVIIADGFTEQNGGAAMIDDILVEHEKCKENYGNL